MHIFIFFYSILKSTGLYKAIWYHKTAAGKGDLLTKLLFEKEQQNLFLFLERGNWLIFQDIYPQFLLYKQSLKINKYLFYLLPYLNVVFCTL